MSDAAPPRSLAEAFYGPNGPISDGGPAGSARSIIDAGIAKPAAEQPLPDRFNGQPAKIGGQGLVLPEAPQQFDPDKLTIPEGLEADPVLMGDFSTAARELGLNHKGAERLMALHARAVQAAGEAQAREVSGWESEARRHFGAELPRVAADIRDAIGTDHDAQTFLSLMDRTGLGSNPAVLRVLARLVTPRRAY